MNQGLAAGPTFAPHRASKPHGPMHNFTRRELLRLGAATAAAELTSLGLHGCGNGSGISPLLPSACSKLTDIEHVVILTQENRSFDHYFGSYRGIRGFSDQSMAFRQPDPANTTNSPVGTLLPFHLTPPQRTQPAPTTSATIGCPSIRVGTTAQWTVL